eukprot:gb/GEZN01009180.1/.p1 GENE.gb/GEZN01009180.1/~~gb/GEZN01009180.1/.p1  ORF type:complete len:178 (-),score=20.27 gb/GEZN01009180.1/:739-1272(-)
MQTVLQRASTEEMPFTSPTMDRGDTQELRMDYSGPSMMALARQDTTEMLPVGGLHLDDRQKTCEMEVDMTDTETTCKWSANHGQENWPDTKAGAKRFVITHIVCPQSNCFRVHKAIRVLHDGSEFLNVFCRQGKLGGACVQMKAHIYRFTPAKNIAEHDQDFTACQRCPVCKLNAGQ